LLFGDGRVLVALVQRLGLGARSQQPVSYDEVLAMAGTKPIAMAGAAFHHWVGVPVRDRGRLALANPAPGWREIQHSMSRAQFGALGPFAAVWVETEPARSVELTFDPTADQIAACVGSDGEGVATYWPAIRAALIEHGITDSPGLVQASVAGSAATGLSQHEKLTRREREVAKLLALGYSDCDIAARLWMFVRTTGVYVHRLLEKLHLRSRWQVAAWLAAEGR
jgi:DNA-binding CsgD family transcriptional regulator